MPRVLDQDEIDQFQRDGFLSFLSNVPPAELKLIRDTLVELHEKGTGFSEGAQFDAMGIDDGEEPRRFPQILHPRSFATHLVRTEFFRTAHDIARQLLGDNVRFSADISLMKPARIGSPTPWHQDEAYHNPNFEYREVSFWLALQPTDQMNSCMAYIPGSHLGEVLTHDFPGGDSRVHALECVDGFDPGATIVCPVPQGGCIIHAGRTLHFAGPNVSDTDRYAYAVIFHLVPTPARQPRVFAWRREQKTARAEREKLWRRRGGLLVHLWRQRSRVRLTNPAILLADMRRAVAAVRQIRSPPR